MNCLLKSATVVDPKSPHHLKVRDILIEKGNIVKIASRIKNDKSYQEISSKKLHVSPGWVDMMTFLGDPGLEHKEDLNSGINAAAAGGFTHICALPNTEPAIDSKSQVEYVFNKTRDAIVDVHPLGAISNGCKGEDISEMYDMHQSGAIAFTDGLESGLNGGLTLRAMLYVKPFNGLIITMPDDHTIRLNGQMNEGVVSADLGMKGIPEISETIVVKRDLDLLKYTNSRLHIAYVSAGESLDIIKAAKKNNKKLSCSIPAYLLAFNDELVAEYDSNYKVIPPLRTDDTIKQLIAGLKDGTIDTITSLHTPQDVESKQCEFDQAEFGMTGLQTTYAMLNQYIGEKVKQSVLVEKLSHNARKILGLNKATITEDTAADITLFDPEREWEFNSSNNASKAKNSPLLGSRLTGAVVGVINNNKIHLNNYGG